MAQPKSPRQQGAGRSETHISAGLTIRRVRVDQSSETALFPDKPYGEINVKDLQQLAKARGMKGFWNMNRDSLVALHSQYDKDHPHNQKPPSRPKPTTSRSKAKSTPGGNNNPGDKEPTVPTNKEKPTALPPGKDNTVPDPQLVKPDAGNFQRDLDEIVAKYKNGMEDAFPVDSARERISALSADFVNSNAGDTSTQMAAATMAASANAKLSEVRMQRILAANAPAVKDPAPPPPAPPVVAQVPPSPPPTPPTGGSGTGGGGTTTSQRNNNPPWWAWVLGSIGALFIAILVIAALADLFGDDDAKADENGGSGEAATATPNTTPSGPTQSDPDTGNVAYDPAKFPKSPAEAAALFGGEASRWEPTADPGGWHLREEPYTTLITPNGFLGEGYNDTKPGKNPDCYAFTVPISVQGTTIWNEAGTKANAEALQAKMAVPMWDDGSSHPCRVLAP